MSKRYLLWTSIALLAASTACGTSHDETTSAPATSAELRGTYAAQEDGTIDTLSFDGTGYFLVPSGCREQSCFELGTWTIDAAQKELTLTAKSGAVRTISVEVLSTIDSAGLVSTRDLVQPGQQLLDQVDKAKLDGQPMQLAQSGVLRILPGGQQLLVNPGCLQGIPTGYGDPYGTKAKDYYVRCPQGTFTPAAG